MLSHSTSISQHWSWAIYISGKLLRVELHIYKSAYIFHDQQNTKCNDAKPFPVCIVANDVRESWSMLQVYLVCEKHN